jgi:hypothetical protein
MRETVIFTEEKSCLIEADIAGIDSISRAIHERFR